MGVGKKVGSKMLGRRGTRHTGGRRKKNSGIKKQQKKQFVLLTEEGKNKEMEGKEETSKMRRWSQREAGATVSSAAGNSPYGSILRPTGADGGRLGPSIMSGGDGAPPLTGDGPYESPVVDHITRFTQKEQASWSAKAVGHVYIVIFFQPKKKRKIFFPNLFTLTVKPGPV